MTADTRARRAAAVLLGLILGAIGGATVAPPNIYGGPASAERIDR